MTRSLLEQPNTASVELDNSTLDEDFDTIPIPIIDITDGHETGLKLTEVAEVLANEAEEIGINPDSDGAYVIGDVNGDHIVIEQVTTVASEGATRSVDTDVILAAPSRGELFRFKSRIENGHLKRFQVAEETPFDSQGGEFSGLAGSRLPDEVVKPTQDYTKTLVEVVDSLHDKNQIGRVPFTTPEASQQDQPKGYLKRLGSTAMKKVRQWYNNDSEAA